MKSTISPSARAACLGSLAALLLAAPCSHAQELTGGISPEVEIEVKYAEGLQRMGLPDYADIVLKALARDYPSADVIIEVLEQKGLIAQGKFDEVKKNIAAKADQDGQQVWAMKLALADGYYAWGRYAEAQGLYNTFFAKFPRGPTPALNDFYLESAYKYAQMLQLMGNEDGAIAAYRNVLKAKAAKHIRRQVVSELAEQILKKAEATPRKEERAKLFEELNKHLTEILWSQDLWFGKAIVMLAHMRMIEDDVEGAMKLIEEYKPQLKNIDKVLKQDSETGEDLTRLSPMAQCRYLLGAMMYEEAQKTLKAGGDRERVKMLLAGKEIGSKGKRSDGALQHFIKVFYLYPSTSWAPDAGVKAQEVEAILVKEFDAKIDTKITEERLENVRQAQFREAQSLFNQQRFADAAEQYIKVLNLFPESQSSVIALSYLAKAYIEQQEDLPSETVIRYLAARFGMRPDYMVEAGDRVLSLAAKYAQLNRPDREAMVYKTFFANFDDHPRTPEMLYRFGSDRYALEDWVGAMSYFTQVVTNYPDTRLYEDALNRTAMGYSKLGKHVEEIKTLKKLIDLLEQKDPPGQLYASAAFREAYAYRELGGKYIPSALNRFDKVIKMLSTGDERYGSSAEDKKNNAALLEGSYFYKGICFALIQKPEEKVPAYREEAIKSLEQLVETFPKSQFAPAALSQIGTLWTVDDKADEAKDALQRLQKDYPDSPEAQNALFMLGMNLLELGRRQEAVRIFKSMFEGQGNYKPAQILKAGTELEKAQEYEIALQAFDKVIASTQNAALLQRAMARKGSSVIALERFDAAVEVLTRMLEAYPNSKSSLEASLLLSQAYSRIAEEEADADKRLGLFNDSIKAMQRVAKFARTSGEKANVNIEVARIHVLRAAAEKAFGSPESAREALDKAVASYQTLILLQDPNDAEVRPYIDTAYGECLPLLLETERYTDAIENADAYETEFPGGNNRLVAGRIRNQARIKMITQGTAPDTSETDETTDETTDEGAAPGDAAAAPEVTEPAAPETE